MLSILLGGTVNAHRKLGGTGNEYNYSTFGQQAPVVQKVDSAIHRINLYPLDSAIGSPNIYPLRIVIYPVESAIHLLNNWGQKFVVKSMYFITFFTKTAAFFL